MSDRPTSWAPYMTWAKRHPKARYDLQGSNLLPCRVEDLPGAREALVLAGENDLGYPPLREAVAARYGTSAEHVALAAGASGANFLALAALARPGDHILVERPGYDPHAGAAHLLGLEVRSFERCFEDGYRLDPARVEAVLTPGTRAIVLSNPHNPSGALALPSDLSEIGRLAAQVGAHVIVDEVYLDALGERTPAPATTLGDVFVSTNSLTKSYGLPGLRAGWLVASPEVVERAWRVRDVVDAVAPFPCDVLAVLAFQNLDRLLRRARSILEPNLSRLREFMRTRTELAWVEPAGGAVAFPRLEGSSDAGPFVEAARTAHGVGVVPGRFFGAPAHFRIALGGAPDRIAAGIEALGRALDAEARSRPS